MSGRLYQTAWKRTGFIFCLIRYAPMDEFLYLVKMEKG